MTSLSRSTLDRALALLVDPEPEHVRYAALELRMVMEMLTYGKLAAASDQLPPEVVNKWQAPQAIKALLEFQELADQSFRIEIADPGQDEPPSTREEFESLGWQLLGKHHALSLAWLRKSYNKVGNMLHAQPPGDTKALDFKNMAAGLRDIAAELERAFGSSIITLTERGGLVFTCCNCSKPIVRSQEALIRGETAVCPTNGCDAEYRLVTGDQNLDVTPLLVKFNCSGCDEVVELHHRKVKVSSKFVCPACGAEHLISGLEQRWKYEALPKQGPADVLANSVPPRN